MRSMTTRTSEAPRFLTESGEPRAYVVVSSARSGSNLLVSYLRQVDRAACFGEVFRSEFPTKPGWTKLVDRLGLPDGSARLHADDLSGWWDVVLGQGLQRRRFLGAKTFYYHRPADRIWDRFGQTDHRVLHLWRDATFDQFVSRALAVATAEWKAAEGAEEQELTPHIDFDRDAYLRYRKQQRADIAATRARYGSSDRYVELEYRQLTDHALMGDLLERLFGQRIDVRETLRRQRGRDKIEYLRNPSAAQPFVADSITGGFADQ
jgi:LPS sulfotransferase NodH